MNLYIVTGHSGGIGAALADALLTPESMVVGVSRRGNPTLPARAITHDALFRERLLDLSDTAALLAALPTLFADLPWPRVARACLINNAGTVAPVAPVGRLDAAQVASSIALNLTAPLLLTDAFLRASEGVADRRILNLSSGAGRKAYPGWSVYCAGKAGLDHFSRVAGLDVPPEVRVAAIAPGIVDTGMQAAIRATPASDFPLREQFVDYKASGQLSEPATVASRLIDYLLSDRMGRGDIVDVRDFS